MENSMDKIIQLKNITKKYGKKTILNDFNLSIFKGEILAILGESGSGKSTLLNIIGLLENWNKGTVQIGNDIFKNINTPKRTLMLREKISYLFQNFALVDNETVDYNLGVALTYSNYDNLQKAEMKEQAINEMGLAGFLKKKVYTLSGGEQQRVALARVLLKPSEIILADEPTGSLDKDNGSAIIKKLKYLQEQGKTIVIVTHDELVAKECNSVISLKKY